jgi:hypothetical protein
VAARRILITGVASFWGLARRLFGRPRVEPDDALDARGPEAAGDNALAFEPAGAIRAQIQPMVFHDLVEREGACL